MKEATPSVVSSIERLYSNQEKADTRMILHASSLSRDHEKIIIQCNDTDVLVLLVYYFSRGHLSDHVYIYMLDIPERSDTFLYTGLRMNLAKQFVSVP